MCRNLVTGEIERYAGDAVILATGGYGTVYYLSTNAVNSNVTAAWRAALVNWFRARTSPRMCGMIHSILFQTRSRFI